MKKIILLSLLFLFSCQETGNGNEGKSELRSFKQNFAQSNNSQGETAKVETKGEGKKPTLLTNLASVTIEVKIYDSGKYQQTEILLSNDTLTVDPVDTVTILDGSIYFDEATNTFHDITPALLAPTLAITQGFEEWGGYYLPRITWVEINGATGYKIYRKEGSSGSYQLLVTINSGNTTFFDDGNTRLMFESPRDNGKPFVYVYYKMRAFNSNGESADSVEENYKGLTSVGGD